MWPKQEAGKAKGVHGWRALIHDLEKRLERKRRLL